MGTPPSPLSILKHTCCEWRTINKKPYLLLLIRVYIFVQYSMKTWFAVSLLLLSLLFSHHTQGIRLDKGSFMSFGHKTIKDLSNGDDEMIVCKDGDECKTAAGITRKLITINTPTSTTTAISEKNEHKKAIGKGFGGKEENLDANTSSSSEEEEYPPEIVDIAEMDYSPARRKPPIHN